jgi:hypothetical protein
MVPRTQCEVQRSVCVEGVSQGLSSGGGGGGWPGMRGGSMLEQLPCPPQSEWTKDLKSCTASLVIAPTSAMSGTPSPCCKTGKTAPQDGYRGSVPSHGASTCRHPSLQDTQCTLTHILTYLTRRLGSAYVYRPPHREAVMCRRARSLDCLSFDGISFGG